MPTPVQVLRRQRAQAGGFAQRHYDEVFRPWRWKVRLIFPIVALAMAPVLVAVAIFVPEQLTEMFYFAGGAVAALYMTLLDSPPEWMDRWRRGAEAERRTERQLRPLAKAGWHLRHDLDARFGNFDHVATGPAGVFVLETKTLSGRISLGDGRVIAERSEHRLDRWSNDDIPRQARRLAAELSEHLQHSAKVRTWVTPVVVLWADFPAGVQECDGVVYVHGKRVREFLTSHEARVAPAVAARIRAALTTDPAAT